MHRGYIKLYRKIAEHPRFKDSEWFHVFGFLMLNATHTPRNAVFDGRVVELKPGQMITGRHSIAEKTGIHPSKVARVMEQLKSDQVIEQQAGSKGSIITILNWSQYQDSDNKPDSSRTATEQLPNTNKNEKNVEAFNGIPPSGEVELPPNFPRTEQDAVMRGMGLCIPSEFISLVYQKAVSRGGRDARDVLIRNFAGYLRVEWKYEQQRAAKDAPKPADPNGVGDFWKDKARLDLVDREIKAIEARASHTATDMLIQPQDKKRYIYLRADRKAIKTRLKL